ncbi:putative Golgi transport protein 1 [Astathelohania contejeani]|uniref:Golgi transport protein 1 n=1 Tax=Astathelohania contejeani TaxID=164912 RepID=A0ABQ7HY98_9MICR|nr:putative Golgi transport protein 1 [Thelohania contejeani]
MESKETGVTILFIGAIFFFLGGTLLLDKALMIAGNLLIIVGTVILARSKILNIFSLNSLQGLLVFCLGILLMMLKYVTIGFIIEFYGLYLLFLDKLPTFRGILKRMLYKAVRMAR